ncbi:MAG: TIGR04255 family protein [Elusimicrobiota bacterium]|jgi:uncharacterized protein (TIGR04255 family)|nr:TIGR04255 family protein [Elusimicrobiota bacterium]
MDFFNDVDIVRYKNSEISNSNILNATIEIRFDAKTIGEVILGTLWSSQYIKEYYCEPQSTGFNQIPFQIRNLDSKLKGMPLFNLFSKDRKFIIGCANGSVSFSNINFTYTVWADFLKEFKEIYEVLGSLTSNKESLGIRYINAFDDNILGKLNLKLQVLGKDIVKSAINFAFNCAIKDRHVRTVVANNLNYQFIDIKTNQNKKINSATIIDIDVIYDNQAKLNNDFSNELLLSHEAVKQVFYGILKEDFLKEKLKK